MWVENNGSKPLQDRWPNSYSLIDSVAVKFINQINLSKLHDELLTVLYN